MKELKTTCRLCYHSLDQFDILTYSSSTGTIMYQLKCGHCMNSFETTRGETIREAFKNYEASKGNFEYGKY